MTVVIEKASRAELDAVVGMVSVPFISRSSEPTLLPSACIEAGVSRCTAAL
jgi:hypothetical protein